MRVYIIIGMLFCFMTGTLAQKPIDQLIQVEKDFAAYSIANGTKEAFLQFLDSNGLVFENGKPVNGITFWNKKERETGVLSWWPLYADISASGDFGYTTGPWTFQPAPKDSVTARGQYTTIWHKNKLGEWKFILDLGVNNTPVNNDTSAWWTLAKSDPTFYKGSLNELLKAEKSFIRRTQKAVNRSWTRTNTYKENYAGAYVFNRNGRLPATFYDPFLDMLNEMPETIHYTVSGSGIASSEDIGYVYGMSLINGKQNNYLRIWVRQKGGWKIAVEVLPY